MALTKLPAEPVARQSLRVEEAAVALGCGRTTIFKLIKEGQLRAVKLGSRTVIPRSEVDRLLAVGGGTAA